MKINNTILKQILNIDLEVNFECAQLSLCNSVIIDTLTFIDDEKYVQQLNSNENITAVFATENLKSLITNKIVILSADPRYDFYFLYNSLAKLNYKKIKSIIHSTTQIHRTSFVSDYNVTIGKDCIIYPNVTILADVEIGDNCIIQSGTVIGSEGFEYKKTSKGILPVFHDGKVIIGQNVHIGSNTSIDKGFSIRNTVINDEVKIDNLIHIAHGVKIGKGSFIIAGTVLGGSTEVGDNSWLGINSSTGPSIKLGKNSFISMGAVVTKNVSENEQVTGNFAIPHKIFLTDLKNKIKNNS
jgi:UDP-3-O-[3-hydroxymyristoyl] glucosamine N-acyltransferase